MWPDKNISHFVADVLLKVQMDGQNYVHKNHDQILTDLTNRGLILP